MISDSYMQNGLKRKATGVSKRPRKTLIYGSMASGAPNQNTSGFMSHNTSAYGIPMPSCSPTSVRSNSKVSTIRISMKQRQSRQIKRSTINSSRKSQLTRRYKRLYQMIEINDYDSLSKELNDLK